MFAQTVGLNRFLLKTTIKKVLSRVYQNECALLLEESYKNSEGKISKAEMEIIGTNGHQIPLSISNITEHNGFMPIDDERGIQ